MLGAAWSAVDIYWSEFRRLGSLEEMEEIGDIAVKIIRGKVETSNKNLAKKEAKKVVVVFQNEEADALPCPRAEVPGFELVEEAAGVGATQARADMRGVRRVAHA